MVSFTLDFEIAEATGIPLLPRPMDGWTRPHLVFVPSLSAAATSPAPAELQCEPSPSNTDQDPSPFAVLREEFPG